MRTTSELSLPTEADPAELPPTDEQLAEISKLQRMRDQPAVSWPTSAAEADAEIRRLWAS